MIEDKVIQKAISRSKREKVEIKYFSELPKINPKTEWLSLLNPKAVLYQLGLLFFHPVWLVSGFAPFLKGIA